MDYKSFTINLMNLNRYKKDADELKLKLEALENIEEGVSGIDYTRIPTRGNPSQKALKRLDLVDKVDALREELYFIQIAIIQIEAILSLYDKGFDCKVREVTDNENRVSGRRRKNVYYVTEQVNG